ncbi:11195_t:CDS:1, partial [Funneliformis caledonium]
LLSEVSSSENCIWHSPKYPKLPLIKANQLKIFFKDEINSFSLDNEILWCDN